MGMPPPTIVPASSAAAVPQGCLSDFKLAWLSIKLHGVLPHELPHHLAERLRRLASCGPDDPDGTLQAALQEPVRPGGI